MIIDGNFVCNKAYYTNRYFFFTLIRTALETFHPDRLFIIFDDPSNSFRVDLYPDYKANRSGDEEKTKYIASVIAHLQQNNFTPLFDTEADDLIYTLTKLLPKEDEVLIYTRDYDLLQLVSERVLLFNAENGEYVYYNRAFLKDKLGVSAEQIKDYKALVGDTGDNYFGVKGIGHKTALKLLHKYHTIDNIYANIDELSPSNRNKLINEKESAYLSRELATLVDVDIDINFDEFQAPSYDVWSLMMRYYK